MFSTDDFFKLGGDGSYRFDPSKLGAAHAWNLRRAVSAMESAIPVVVIDNTNTQAWEMRPYAEAALAHGYTVRTVPPCHGVCIQSGCGSDGGDAGWV